ncbi:MAG: ribosome maturation factor RimM [Thermoleophilaceae bacterium]
MTEAPASERLVTAGKVGRTHGLDGSFRVIAAEHGLAKGTVITIAGVTHGVISRRGTDEAPIVRVEGITSREAAAALGGELLLVSELVSPLADGEWLASDLIGCVAQGLGAVVRVIPGPSCDVLELEGGQLVPLIADAVKHVDIESARISVDRAFLGLEDL